MQAPTPPETSVVGNPDGLKATRLDRLERVMLDATYSSPPSRWDYLQMSGMGMVLCAVAYVVPLILLIVILVKVNRIAGSI